MPDTQTSLKDALKKGQFLKVGHRGLPNKAMENTLRSFQLAVKAGANMIECDVMLTRDGVPVVYHDETFARLFQMPHAVSAIDSDQLPNPVLHFEQLCHWLSHNHCYLDCELKTYDALNQGAQEAFLATVIPIIKDHCLEKRTLVVSFDWPLIQSCCRLYPDIMTGFNLEANSPVPDFSCGISVICPDKAMINKNNMATWKAEKQSVIPYTVNEKDEMEQLISLGVHGITTDRVDALNLLLQQNQL